MSLWLVKLPYKRLCGLVGSFLNHLGFLEPNNKPITNYCDSMVALVYIKDPKYHENTKHIKFKYNLIWNEVHLEYIPTCQMVVDPLIKLIPPSFFEKHVKEMGLHRL